MNDENRTFWVNFFVVISVIIIILLILLFLNDAGFNKEKHVCIKNCKDANFDGIQSEDLQIFSARCGKNWENFCPNCCYKWVDKEVS